LLTPFFLRPALLLLLLLLLVVWAGMPDLMASNPFPPAGNTWNEGCNWLYEGACTDIDFVSIHTWADQWTKREQVPAGFNSPEQFWEW
jgi:hypothetical protein